MIASSFIISANAFVCDCLQDNETVLAVWEIPVNIQEGGGWGRGDGEVGGVREDGRSDYNSVLIKCLKYRRLCDH